MSEASGTNYEDISAIGSKELICSAFNEVMCYSSTIVFMFTTMSLDSICTYSKCL